MIPKNEIGEETKLTRKIARKPKSARKLQGKALSRVRTLTARFGKH